MMTSFNEWRAAVIVAARERGAVLQAVDVSAKEWKRWFILNEPLEATVDRVLAHAHNTARAAHLRRTRTSTNTYGHTKGSKR